MTVVERVTAEWAEHHVKVDKELVGRSKEIWAVIVNGERVLVGGVVKESMLGFGRVWLVTCDAFSKNRLETLRAARPILDEVGERFGKLVAFAKPGRDARFAEFCGFQPTGLRGEWMRLEK